MLQHCCDIVLNACNIVPTLQCRVALKIIIANCPMQHHLKIDVEYVIPVWDSLPVSKDSTCTLSPTFNQMTNQTIIKKDTLLTCIIHFYLKYFRLNHDFRGWESSTQVMFNVLTLRFTVINLYTIRVQNFLCGLTNDWSLRRPVYSVSLKSQCFPRQILKEQKITDLSTTHFRKLTSLLT